MLRWIIPFFICATALLTFSQVTKSNLHKNLLNGFFSVEKKYQLAARLSEEAGEDDLKNAAADKVYSDALLEYNKLIPLLTDGRSDSLLLISSIHCGIINHYFDSTALALNNYLRAIDIKNRTGAEDSLIFQPLLFAGSIYYKNALFDSAFLYLKKAETIKQKYSVALQEEQRMYNLLGVLYYEAGNLKQAKNYTEQALSLNTKIKNIENAQLSFNYKLNIASILIKLEEYAEAEVLLNSMPYSESFQGEINHKLGFIYFKRKEFAKAISYLNRTEYNSGNKLLDIYLNKSKAYSGLNEADSADYYLSKAKTENLKINGLRKKNLYSGNLLSTEAGFLAATGKYKEALPLYQAAIIALCNNFDDTAISKNPADYIESVSFIDLFNTLIGKANIQNKLFENKADEVKLSDALNSYWSAFNLANYVEKTYNSDESRLFLNNIKHNVHNKPIELCLKLYELTGKKKYLEDAYLFDQGNKASILSLSIRESEITTQSKKTNEQIKEVSLLKTNITRLSLKAAAITDSNEISKITVAIRNDEIKLAGLQDKIKTDPAWQQANLKEQIPSIKSLQKKLDNKSAVISYHLSDNEMLALIITRNKLDYYKAPIDSNFFLSIEAFKQALHQTAGGQRYEGINASRYLFSALIKPLQPGLTQTERLVIIPDDELHYLPFEALQDDNDSYLMQKYSVQYLYSTALFQSEKNYSRSSGILSFAPFASNGYIDSNGSRFSKLSASSDEIKDLQGKSLIDTSATKENFIEQANHLPVIHLATHASVNNEDANRSFIAFYPSNNDYKLYAGEIYNMRLDSTELVILSACETGTGKLIKGEGLMSLSRAFAYAGCKNIITSLWKAEDATTSFITKQLHTYLSKGFTKDKALRQAKLDLLKSTDINPQFKTPNYWAHLVFVGNYEEGPSSSNWIWVAFAIIFFAFVYLLMLRKKPRRNDRA